MDRDPPPNTAPLPAGWEVVTREVRELVARSQAGDAWAFADLQRRYYLPVWRFCRARFADPRDAEDAAMETFVNFYRALPSLSDARRTVQFLFGIARNVCNYRLERLRRRQVEVPLPRWSSGEEQAPEAEEVLAPGADQVFWREERRRELASAIERLPAPERETLLLHYQGRFTYDQIAQILAVTRETVRHRIRQARRRLAMMLPEMAD
jgi:RNA polymerase sigma-70 factor (ECF subfamily)